MTSSEFGSQNSSPISPIDIFKSLSDAIWARRPARHRKSTYRVPAVLPPAVAQRTLNDTLQALDNTLIYGGAEKWLTLAAVRPNKTYGKHVRIMPPDLRQPKNVQLETGVWDTFVSAGNNTPISQPNTPVVSAPDIYYRGLALLLGYESRGVDFSIVYAMQRSDATANQPTNLDVTIEHPALETDGLERTALQTAELTESQEIQILHTFQRIGGIVLPHHQ